MDFLISLNHCGGSTWTKTREWESEEVVEDGFVGGQFSGAETTCGHIKRWQSGGARGTCRTTGGSGRCPFERHRAGVKDARDTGVSSKSISIFPRESVRADPSPPDIVVGLHSFVRRQHHVPLRFRAVRSSWWHFRIRRVHYCARDLAPRRPPRRRRYSFTDGTSRKCSRIRRERNTYHYDNKTHVDRPSDLTGNPLTSNPRSRDEERELFYSFEYRVSRPSYI